MIEFQFHHRPLHSNILRGLCLPVAPCNYYLLLSRSDMFISIWRDDTIILDHSSQLYMTLLFFVKGLIPVFSGVLIKPNWVLTTANPLHGRNGKLQEDQIIVSLGKKRFPSWSFRKKQLNIFPLNMNQIMMAYL